MLYRLLLVFFALFFDSHVGIPLGLTVVVLLAWDSNDQIAFFLAFVVGLYLDVVSFRTLGLSSLVLLSVVVLVRVMRSRFDAHAGWLLSLAGMVSQVIWHLFGVAGPVAHVFYQGLLVFLLWYGARLFGKRDGVYLRQ